MSSIEQSGERFNSHEGMGWKTVDTFMPLGADEVQVWRVRAVGEGPLYEACFKLLSPDEIERWKRLRVGVARDEFVIGRGCLRRLLGDALRREARGIVFSAGKHGKPGVDGTHFNVTHSKGLILLALGRAAEIGIDVEWMDSSVEVMDIARDTFAPGEIEYLAAAQGQERIEAFYRCWVRKEAVAKAHGQGITLELKEFQVDLTSEEEKPVTVAGLSGEPQTFYVRGLPVGGNYAGGLALTSPGCQVHLFELSPGLIIGHEDAR